MTKCSPFACGTMSREYGGHGRSYPLLICGTLSSLYVEVIPCPLLRLLARPSAELRAHARAVELLQRLSADRHEPRRDTEAIKGQDFLEALLLFRLLLDPVDLGDHRDDGKRHLLLEHEFGQHRQSLGGFQHDFGSAADERHRPFLDVHPDLQHPVSLYAKARQLRDERGDHCSQFLLLLFVVTCPAPDPIRPPALGGADCYSLLICARTDSASSTAG